MARLTNATSAIMGFLFSVVLMTSCSTAKDEKTASIEETAQAVAETKLDDNAITPSFDCAKAKTEVEKLICIHFDSELERLDREINKRYKIWYSKAENKKNVIENQKRWLKNSWIRLGKCSLNLIPKWNNPDDKTCVKRILKNRINFINEKIENIPVTAPENQIELGILMNGGEFEFVQHNGAINYKDYSALPFSRTEQNFVCEAVKIGKYEKYNFNENKIEKKFKKEFEDKILSNMKGNGYFNDGYLDKIFLEKENYGSLEYSENYGKTGMPAYVFQINRIETKRRESDKFSPRTYYECKRDFMGVFYISGPGSFKLLGHASYPIQQIFNVDCGGGESFIIVDKKAYLATRDKNKNITQIDRLKSVECQNVGYVCDEQTFAMCKYPEGVK